MSGIRTRYTCVYVKNNAGGILVYPHLEPARDTYVRTTRCFRRGAAPKEARVVLPRGPLMKVPRTRDNRETPVFQKYTIIVGDQTAPMYVSVNV